MPHRRMPEAGVPVSHTGPRIPALVTPVTKTGEVCAKEADVVLKTAHVALAAKSVDTKEMTRETVAEPPPRLRLKQPVLPSAPAGERPAVVVAGKVKGPAGSKTDLDAKV